MALLHRLHVQESLARFLHAREELACGTARVEVLALPLPVLHCPGCSISCMAIPGYKMALGEYPPFLMGAQGLDSLWNKAWPSPLHGKHWHIQVILSTPFSKLRTRVL